MNQVRQEAAAMFDFGSISGSGGSLPDFDLGTIKGEHIVIRLSDYSPQLSLLASVFLFVAAVIAVMIIFG